MDGASPKGAHKDRMSVPRPPLFETVTHRAHIPENSLYTQDAHR